MSLLSIVDNTTQEIAMPVTAKTPKWLQSLSTVSWVNSVAISDDGSRVVGVTYVHDYENKDQPHVFAKFGTYCYDSSGARLWAKPVIGWDGVFAAGISGDGTVAAGGGLFTNGLTAPQLTGLLTIFDAANGNVLFDSPAAMPNPIAGRVNVVALSSSGNVAAAAADQLYVFIGGGGTYVPAGSTVPPGAPDFRTVLGRVAAVAVHPSGTWLAACNQQGQILVATISAGAIDRTFLLKVADESIGLAAAPAAKAPVLFLSVAISAKTDAFIAGGCNVVYRGTLSDVIAGNPLVRYDAGDPAAPAGSLDPITSMPRAKPNVRSTSISGDGATFAAVANRSTSGNNTGQLLIYTAETPAPTAKASLPYNPNGVSLDGAAQFVAVSDGYPVGKLAAFYRFDLSGQEIWRCTTPNMNWPVAVSADGSAIAGGGDDGCLYYFLP
jgi:hypothetical protein